MFKNLPPEINLNHLQKFNFGNIEAKDDTLLFDSICRTSSILEFINGKKNIVLGEKGTGKTALFRLIKEEKLKFTPKNGFENIIIPIEDNFQYKTIKSKLLKLISTGVDEDSYKYQMIWEVFFYKKIIDKLEKLSSELTPSLKNSYNLCTKILNSNSNEQFISIKKTFGIKLQDIATTFVPDIYYTSEPTIIENKEKIKKDSIEKLEINLDEFKNDVNDYLIKNNYNLIIIIDRLDEFVSKSSIDSQLEMLEALIAFERDNSKYSNIELKIFLRDDLFKQLSFDGIGYDKVITKKVDLTWNKENIREFIARRIYSNYKRVFNIEYLKLEYDSKELEIETIDEIENYKRASLFKRICRKVVKKLNPQHYEQKFQRKISLNDDLNKNLILTLFPRYVEHKNPMGKIVEIDIFDFFETHFNLGTGNSIPRLILIFLEKWLSTVTTYYMSNLDQSRIKQNKQNCFEIVKHGFFEKAYSEFRNEIYLSFAKLNPDFEQKILLLRERIGNRYSFQAKDIKSLVAITENAELFYFCNYLLHIGYLRRTNNTTTIEDMKFEIPLIFRKIE